MAKKQENRILGVATPLDQDVLRLSSFSGMEAMSSLFTYQLIMESDDPVDPAEIIGKGMTWKVQFKNGPPRFFNGIVSRFAAGPRSRRKAISYRAEVVPWLWLL